MHKHEFTIVNAIANRYRCACGVWGYRLGRRRILPMACGRSVEIDGKRTRCGADAVHVDGDRNHARCAAHAREADKAA